MEEPKIDNERTNDLFKRLSNVIIHFLKQNPKITNEELHLAIWRIEQMHLTQPMIQMYSMYVQDMQKEQSMQQVSKKSGLYG